jgi:multiple sugar transport system permease protein
MGSRGSAYTSAWFRVAGSVVVLPLAKPAFFNEHGVEWGPLMAASVLFTTPALFVFLVAQKYFIQGISLTGLK